MPQKIINFNAKVFADADAAYLYRQEELTAQLLEKTVLDLLNDSSKLKTMSEKTASLALNNSAKLVANMIRNRRGL